MRKITILLSFIFVSFIFQTAFAQTKVAPLNIKQRTLKNGLKVVSLQDNSSPTVTVQIWFDVGSKNDPNGRNGFAHLFEHIFFNGSENYPHGFREAMDDLGATNHAYGNPTNRKVSRR